MMTNDIGFSLTNDVCFKTIYYNDIKFNIHM
jgi:hypothetical protein